MLPHLQENFILGEATSSHFFRVSTSTQQLLFWDSYFFRIAAFFSLFQKSHFFAGVIFFRIASFFGAKLLQNSHFLRIRSSFTEITFCNSHFIRRSSLGQIYLKKSSFFKAGTSAQYRLFQKR